MRIPPLTVPNNETSYLCSRRVARAWSGGWLPACWGLSGPPLLLRTCACSGTPGWAALPCAAAMLRPGRLRAQPEACAAHPATAGLLRVAAALPRSQTRCRFKLPDDQKYHVTAYQALINSSTVETGQLPGPAVAALTSALQHAPRAAPAAALRCPSALPAARTLPSAPACANILLTPARAPAPAAPPPQVHHMIIHACTQPQTDLGTTFDCMTMPVDCSVYYMLWAPGAGLFETPPLAAYPIGKGTVTYVALQVGLLRWRGQCETACTAGRCLGAGSPTSASAPLPSRAAAPSSAFSRAACSPPSPPLPSPSPPGALHQPQGPHWRAGQLWLPPVLHATAEAVRPGGAGAGHGPLQHPSPAALLLYRRLYLPRWVLAGPRAAPLLGRLSQGCPAAACSPHLPSCLSACLAAQALAPSASPVPSPSWPASTMRTRSARA